MQLKTPRIQHAFLLASNLILIACLSATTASAQGTGTGTGSSSGSPTTAAPLGPLNPANWKMPSFKMPEMKMPSFKSMLPQSEEKQRIVKKKDSFFSEIGQTASNSWTRTKEVFNPQKLNPTRFFTASSRTPSKPEPEAKPGFFSSLFSPGKTSADKSSATDFLKQQRPQL